MECAQFIKEIGRGKEGARSLNQEQAYLLWKAVLEGDVSDLELGAILLALRIKGESVQELAGFLQACHATIQPLPALPGVPVVIPSYNGARHIPNLVPLLAVLLAEQGIPVLIHGVLSDPMSDLRHKGARVTTGEIFQALGLPIARHSGELPALMAESARQRRPVFVPIHILAPRIARILFIRRSLGVRNSAHALVKLLQPFDGQSWRLTSYTHPEYYELLKIYLAQSSANVMLLRGTEGEVVANARRAQRLDVFLNGEMSTPVKGEEIALESMTVLPASRDAATTADWTQSVLAGERPVPAPVAEQVRWCEHYVKILAEQRLAA